MAYDKSLSPSNEYLSLVLDSCFQLSLRVVLDVALFDKGEESFRLKKVDMPWRGSITALTYRDGFTYFLTAAHCLDYKFAIETLYNEGELARKIKPDKAEPFLVSDGKAIMLSEVYYNNGIDLAVLRAEARLPCCGRIADHTLLEIGDAVYGAGFVGLSEENKNEVSGRITSMPPEKYKIYVDSLIVHGMSGGPHAVFKDGMPYLFGINVSCPSHNTGSGVAYKVRQALDEAGLL